MSAPRTRVGEGATEFERELLRSWQDEAPAAGARQKALGIVGAGAALGVTSATTAAGAAAGAFVQAAAPKAVAAGLVVFAKWVVAGSLLAAGVVTVAPHLRPRASGAPATAAPGPVPVPAAGLAPSPASVPALAPAAELAPASPASGDGPGAAMLHAPAPPRAAPSARMPVAAPAAPPAALPVPEGLEAAPVPPAPEERHGLRALGDQVASVDRARSALAAGSSTEALRLLDDYEARFPTGGLAQEATVLRVEALVQQGNQAGATALGDRFIAAHPASPYAARVRKLLEGARSP